MTIGDNIFDEPKKAKKSAIEVLEKAKQQEKEKMKQGYKFVHDGIRCMILKRASK